MLKRAEEIISESQAGFRPGRSTVDQLFTLRQVTEKYLERGKDLYCCYIDFEKAFDSVWQEGVWKALRFFGFSSKIIKLLQSLYLKSESAVRVNGDLTDWFSTTVGVRQGCVISPLLFNLLLELVMLYATHDTTIGAQIQGYLISNLRFADDIVLLAENVTDLQTIVDKVFQSSSDLGLKINIAKTEVQTISRNRNPAQHQHQWATAQASRWICIPGWHHREQRHLQGRHQTQDWKSHWSSAETTTYMGCKRYPTVNQDGALPGPCVINSLVWSWDMDTEKRRWEQAAGIWNDVPKENTGSVTTWQDPKQPHSSNAKPQPHYNRPNKPKEDAILWSHTKDAHWKISKDSLGCKYHWKKAQGKTSKEMDRWHQRKLQINQSNIY